MEFKELEKRILDTWQSYSVKHSIELNDTYALHKLGEEYGEFIQSYLIYKKMCKKKKIKPDSESFRDMSEELSDLIGTSILIAKQLDIDLEKVLMDKWLEWAPKANI